MTSLTGPDLLASWLWRSITDPGVPGSIPGRGTRREYFISGLFLLLLHLVPGARMTTVGAQGRCNGNGVTKEPGNSRKHLIQMFHCWMECSSAAKRSTNNQYVCKYIGRINDQSNWSGPFSLVVMTLDYRSRGTWFDPRSGHSTGIFSFRSISPPSTKECCWPRQGLNPQPPGLQSDSASNWATQACIIGLGKSGYNVNIFSYFSAKTYVVGTH